MFILKRLTYLKLTNDYSLSDDKIDPIRGYLTKPDC
jgi:hypothetical protein